MARAVQPLDVATVRAITAGLPRSSDARARRIFKDASDAVRDGRTFLSSDETPPPQSVKPNTEG